jgi:hypothetical protein
MTKTKKIILGISLVVVVLAVLGASMVFIGYQTFKGVNGLIQDVAKEIYGGKLPSQTQVEFAIKTQAYKMALYKDVPTKSSIMIVQSPDKDGSQKSFSEPDVKAALQSTEFLSANSRTRAKFDNLIYYSKPATFHLGPQVVHISDYKSLKNGETQIGVLNLDNTQMTFMITVPIEASGDYIAPNFLADMPIIQNDSHMQPHSK